MNLSSQINDALSDLLVAVDRARRMSGESGYRVENEVMEYRNANAMSFRGGGERGVDDSERRRRLRAVRDVAIRFRNEANKSRSKVYNAYEKARLARQVQRICGLCGKLERVVALEKLGFKKTMA